jgi:hypothetical protein
MPKVRQLLKSASVETAARRRICHHNRRKHEIAAGERCLVLRDATSNGSKNYCTTCASAVLDRVQMDLDLLRDELLTQRLAS